MKFEPGPPPKIESTCPVVEPPQPHPSAPPPSSPVLPPVMYIYGGKTSSGGLATAETFDPDSKVWTTLASMSTPRQQICSGAALGGFPYAVGGRNPNDGYVRLATAERYDAASDQWVPLADKAATSQECATAALGGYLYALGGFGQTSSTSLDTLETVERYDPDSDSWSFVQPMSQKRYRFGAAALGGFIYAIGGQSTSPSIFVKEVERYNPGTDAWTAVASMNVVRGGLAATVLDGLIYVAGGQETGEGQQKTAERYDPSSDTWTMIAL